ncbi:MAG: CoA pyrophosphatase [Chloroflexota bacterium]
MPYTLADVQRALALPDFDGRAAQRPLTPHPRAAQRPADFPGQPRQGGVLLLLYPIQRELHLVLTKRPDNLPLHGGQVSLPGGRREPGESHPMAALRETQEELGIDPAEITLLGELTPLYILPSDFEVHPFVGWMAERPRFRPHTPEVEKVIEAPISLFLEPANRAEEEWEIRGYTLLVPHFLVYGHKVWGATAMILSEFAERLRVAQLTQ